MNNVAQNDTINTVQVQNQRKNIMSVTNPEAAAGGSDIEIDSNIAHELRGPWKVVQHPRTADHCGTDKTSGVCSANVVVMNNTMEVDADGNPPKSIHAYVLGGIKRRCS
ncbi:hypothetical protein ACEQPO_08150 [Bacillus sp. SL00103]